MGVLYLGSQRIWQSSRRFSLARRLLSLPCQPCQPCQPVHLENPCRGTRRRGMTARPPPRYVPAEDAEGAAQPRGQRGALLGLGRIVALPPLIHFIPDSLTYSVHLFLKRQCDRTLGALPEGAPLSSPSSPAAPLYQLPMQPPCDCRSRGGCVAEAKAARRRSWSPATTRSSTASK